VKLYTTEEAMVALSHTVADTLKTVTARGVEKVPLTNAPGRTLAVDITADRDQPPFHRAAMDGIAIPDGGAVDVGTTYVRKGVLPAGGDPRVWSQPKAQECLEIMTGAAVPDGYGTVIRYEDLSRDKQDGHKKDGQTVFTISGGSYRGGENIHRKGTDFGSGTVLLKAGSRLAAPHLAVLASSGVVSVPVRPLPSIVILGTGDELVEPESSPLDHQIRASNTWTIAGELTAWGFPPADHRIHGDNRNDLERTLKALVDQHDVVLISGAVSRGRYDFIPDILYEIGVEILVHGVRQRPGKPLLIGTAGTTTGTTTVMGLPGNPVSSLVSVRRYLVPLLVNQTIEGGMTQYAASGFPVTTEDDIDFGPELTWFPVVDIATVGGVAGVRLRHGNGSGDFYHVAGSAGFIEVPEARRNMPAGSKVQFFPWGC